MRVIDLIREFKGRYMFFLDPNGWHGRPWDSPVRINNISEGSEGSTIVSTESFDLEFVAKPYESIFVFERYGFTVFAPGGALVIDRSGAKTVETKGVFSFISGDRSIPYKEADPEHVIASLHDGFCRNFRSLMRAPG